MAATHTTPTPYVVELANTLLTYSDLASVDDLDTDQLSDLLVTLAKASEFASAEVGRLALTARHKGVGPHLNSRSTGEYLAHKTRTTPSRAHALIRHAETAARFQAFYFAQDHGTISSDHIEQVSRVWRKHPNLEDALVRDQQLLADTAVRLTPWQFGEVLARWVMHMQPDEAVDGYSTQEDARYVETAFDLEHNLLFQGQLDPINGEGFANLLERRSQQLFYQDWADAVDENQTRVTPEPNSVLALRRTHAQRRADALVSLVVDGSSTPVDAQRPEPLVVLTVDEDTLADAVEDTLADITGPDIADGDITDITDDADVEDAVADTDPADSDDAGSADSDDGGSVEGRRFDPDRRCETGRGVAIPPRVMLKHFLTDRIRRIVFDSNGVVLNAGRAVRLFTPTQKQVLQARDRTCRFPGCTIHAHRCEADHLVAFVDGGATDVGNGQMLCRHHHRLKTKGWFFVRRNKDGPPGFYTPLGVPIT